MPPLCGRPGPCHKPHMMQLVEEALRANLLKAARTFARKRKISLATLARRAHGDSRFFENLPKKGVSFTARKYDDVAKYIIANAPEGFAWPPLYTLTPPAKPTRPKE